MNVPQSGPQTAQPQALPGHSRAAQAREGGPRFGEHGWQEARVHLLLAQSCLVGRTKLTCKSPGQCHTPHAAQRKICQRRATSSSHRSRTHAVRILHSPGLKTPFASERDINTPNAGTCTLPLRSSPASMRSSSPSRTNCSHPQTEPLTTSDSKPCSISGRIRLHASAFFLSVPSCHLGSWGHLVIVSIVNDSGTAASCHHGWVGHSLCAPHFALVLCAKNRHTLQLASQRDSTAERNCRRSEKESTKSGSQLVLADVGVRQRHAPLNPCSSCFRRFPHQLHLSRRFPPPAGQQTSQRAELLITSTSAWLNARG